MGNNKMLKLTDDEFKKYGQLLDFDAGEILKYLESTPVPAEGNIYVASDENFEKLSSVKMLESRYFGKGTMEAGYCNGNNCMLNCGEYHGCIEINIALNDCTLFLALQTDIANGIIDSSAFEEVFVKKGQALLLYPGVLHFSPVVVNGKPFRMAVLLSRGTNTPLAEKDSDKKLWMKNKWLIAHKDTLQASKGAYIGITGENRRGSLAG